MQKSVLEYLEKTAVLFPEKEAFSDGTEALTFAQLHRDAQGVGSALCSRYAREPIGVFMHKHPHTIAAFFGVVYSGNYYVPIDSEMSPNKIQMILDTLKPRAMICDKKTIKEMEGYSYPGDVYLYSDIKNESIQEGQLQEIRDKSVDVDPVYIVFTSGSTGAPKGVVASHRSIIDYIDHLTEILDVTETTVFGNQVPLYVDACLKEVYGTIKSGASTYLIPKSLFMFPVRLIEYMNRYKINTVCWVASAFVVISSLGTLELAVPQYWRVVAFGSEIFPLPQFMLWKKALPQARFINLYGPTEATGMSCFYEVNREFSMDEAIPIGKAFPNKEVFLFEDGEEITQPDRPGGIYIRGTGVTIGYFNAPDLTKAVFVQNPKHNLYPDIVYDTGDVGKYNRQGELVFVSRRDYQIKRRGYRIELMEIEACANRMEAIQAACCVYDKGRDRIVLYYCGQQEDGKKWAMDLRKLLPPYAWPDEMIWIQSIPLTNNGKIDRALLKSCAEAGKKPEELS